MSELAKLQFVADVSTIREAITVLDQMSDKATAAQVSAAGLGEKISAAGKDSAGIKQTIRDLDELTGKLDPTMSQFRQLDDAAKTLQKSFDSGLINSDYFNDFNQLLDVQREKLVRQRDELTGYAAQQRAEAAEAAAASKQAALEAAASAKEEAAAAKQAAQAEAAAAKQAAQAQAEAARQAEQAHKEAAAAAAQEAAAINRLEAVLDPASAAMKQLAAQQELLNNALKNGTINEETYTRLKTRLDEVSASANKATISAGQMRQGWGNAAQQFVDIGTTLAMGMSPLQVLIQQGPQLASSFGGFGNTLKVFLGLINPVSVAVTAAVSALGYFAYQAYQSEQQTNTFNQALASTGDQSGLTATKLKSLSTTLQGYTGASEDNVNAALVAATKLGLSADELQKYSYTALMVSQQTGESVDSLVQKFGQLANDPVKALQALGTQFGFLNPQIAEQVINLVNAGQQSEAYDLVLNQVNATMGTVAKNHAAEMSGISGWWQQLTTDAINYMNAYNKAINQTAPAAPEKQNTTGLVTPTTTEGQLSFIRGDSTAASADSGAAAAKAKLDAGKAYLDVQQASLKYETATQRTMRDIEATQRNIAALKAGGASEAELASAQKLLATQKAQLATQQKRQDKQNAPKAPKAVQSDAGQDLVNQYTQQNATLDEQIKKLQTRAVLEKNQTQEETRATQIRNQLAQLQAISGTTALTTSQKQILAHRTELSLLADQLESRGQQVQRLKQIAEINDQIAKQTLDTNAAISAQNDTLGLSDKAAQRRLRDLQLEADLRAKGATQSQIDTAVSNNTRKDNADDAASGDYISGMKTGLANWAEAATNYSDIAKNAISSAMDTGVDAVANFALTGKNTFADFTKSILQMITQIIAKLLIMQAIKSSASAFGWDIGGLTANAKGGVYNSPSLSAFSNGVYNSPQTFAFDTPTMFAKGGVFAEAGPEAIMPLSRDGNGRLGVRVDGGSSASGFGSMEVNAYVSIDSSGNAQTGSDSDSQVGKNFGDALNAQIVQVISNESRDGGILAQMFRKKS